MPSDDDGDGDAFQLEEDPRGSNLPVALFAKLEVFKENRSKAEKTREERSQRALLLQEDAEKRYEQLRQQKDRMLEKHREAVEELERQRALNLQSGLFTREREALGQVEREEDKRQFMDKSREQVLKAKVLIKQMNRHEGEDAEKKRQEGAAQRKALATALKEKTDHVAEKRSAAASSIKSEVAAGVKDANTQVKTTRSAKASRTRREKGDWKAEKERSEAEYLAKAAEKRAKAIAGRETARRVKNDLVDTRQMVARVDRDNDMVSKETFVTKEKEKLLIQHKKMRAERYRERYATQTEADEFQNSELKSLYKYTGGSPKEKPRPHW